MAINYDAPIDIRDGRNGNWFWVDKEVWQDARLNASDKVLYGTLAYFSNQKTQISFPSITTLQSQSGLSRRQTYYSIKKLEVFSYLAVERKRGKPNLYTLLDTAITSAKIAPVQNQHRKGVQNKTSNKSIYNKKSSSKKMYYDDLEVRRAQNKLWVIPPDGGQWLEFAGNEKDIVYR